MSLNDRMRAKAAYKMIWCDGIAYRVRPVDTRALAKVGQAQLEGSASYRQAMSEARAGSRADSAQAVGADEQTVAKLRDLEAEEERGKIEHYFRVLQESPERSEAFAKRMDAYICAAVVGSCDVEIPGAKGVLVVAAADVKEAATKSGAKAEPTTFVMLEKDQDLDRHRYWVQHLPQQTRLSLGASIMGLQSAVREVAPFRFGSSVAPTVRSDSPPVRETAQ